MLRLGIIDYLNTLPVYYRFLEAPEAFSCQSILGYPTELNRQIANDQLDISVISSFAYAKQPERYYLLPNLSVSAKGPVGSIFLFSHQPLEHIEGIVRLTHTSASSIHLLWHLLKDHSVDYAFDDQITREQCQAELLIGDEAIRAKYQPEFPYCYDLSELWYQQTQLPFVFAVWVVRREVFEESPEEVRAIYQALLSSKNEVEPEYERLGQAYYEGLFPTAKMCEDYLRNLHYDFSQPFQEGFLRFQHHCHQMGFLPRVADLAFIDGLFPKFPL